MEACEILVGFFFLRKKRLESDLKQNGKLLMSFRFTD